jgi:hypothetical protein
VHRGLCECLNEGLRFRENKVSSYSPTKTDVVLDFFFFIFN